MLKTDIRDDMEALVLSSCPEKHRHGAFGKIISVGYGKVQLLTKDDVFWVNMDNIILWLGRHWEPVENSIRVKIYG